ncbi:MAG: Mur ligase family protein [Clostridia bacterium]|nr:Mur ligase family protein [Clostridia bacterium]
MLLTGIICHDSVCKTANLINIIMSSTGKKVSIVDSKNLSALDARTIKSYIHELEKNKVDVLILKINIFDTKKEILDYLNFDIMVYSDKSDDLLEIDISQYRDFMLKIFSLLDEKGVAIVSVDDDDLLQLLEGLKHSTITYGFNSKASMTTSSVGDRLFEDNFMCCLQRSISTKDGFKVEPQEYKVRVESDGVDPYQVLAAATFAVVNGIDLNRLH